MRSGAESVPAAHPWIVPPARGVCHCERSEAIQGRTIRNDGGVSLIALTNWQP
jgi:hypothetical protein